MSKIRSSSSDPTPIRGVRVFGECVGDLDLEVDLESRVETAVKVVARFSNFEQKEEEVWSLPVGTRVLELLKIVRQSQGEGELFLVRKCPSRECGERLELPLPLEVLVELGEEALEQGGEMSYCLDETSEIAVRRATGLDQQAWQGSCFSDRERVKQTMLETLVVKGREHLKVVEEEHERELSEAMMEFDPLVAFRLTTGCPACEEEVHLAVDLEHLCLRRIAGIQGDLMKVIHRLASAYGWSEAEILGLSRKRRAYYLETLEEEELAS